ncbi:Mannose-1-phosphate guanylyltransferase 1 [Kluyvera cryocrescens]|uniref:Mannose-1-phosphate guanylyltransferase 1 n=1 Tax=Kluyvera cryocrescens TaxID=580 RepID=A0A485BXN4_KLUCR|nr:Mannose-1-phosphate guanylyltransferase 1 [Kluyvera cryocrescens]
MNTVFIRNFSAHGGKYDSIDEGVRYQVKRITVKPGEGLSLQLHHHRAEHWVVVAGVALVTINGCENYYLKMSQRISCWC